MKARVLVADDSATIQKVVELTLSRIGVQLVQARSADEALRRAKDQKPDLFLIDHAMPDRSGQELGATLRQDPQLKNIPMILMTSAVNPVDAGTVRRAGFADVVTKPFDSQTLIGKVKQFLAAPAHVEHEEEAPAAAATAVEEEEAFLLEPQEVAEEEVRLPAEVMERIAAEAAQEASAEGVPTYDLPMEDAAELPLGSPVHEGVEAVPAQEITDLGIGDRELAVEVERSVSRPRTEPGPVQRPPAPPSGREAYAPPAAPQALTVPPELVQTLAREVAERVATHMVRELRSELLERVDRLLWEVVPELAEQLLTQEIRRIRELVEGKQ
jgi:CheY-like chemotaxis protein